MISGMSMIYTLGETRLSAAAAHYWQIQCSSFQIAHSMIRFVDLGAVETAERRNCCKPDQLKQACSRQDRADRSQHTNTKYSLTRPGVVWLCRVRICQFAMGHRRLKIVKTSLLTDYPLQNMLSSVFKPAPS